MEPEERLMLRITELCELRNISLYELSLRSGVPKSTLLSIAEGKSRNPGIRTISRLADGLDVTLRELFDSEIFED